MASLHSSTRVSPTAPPSSDKPFVLVVGVDVDPTGELVLAAALPYVRYFPNVETHVVHVVTNVKDAMKEESEAQDSLLDARVAALQTFVLARWPVQETHSVRLHIGLGDAAQELAQIARDVQADLIVTGTNDRGLLATVLHPSTSETLRHTAPCPVLVVREKRYDGKDLSPAIEPPHPPGVGTPHPVPAHTYHYRRTLPLRTPDANVIPTGV